MVFRAGQPFQAAILIVEPLVDTRMKTITWKGDATSFEFRRIPPRLPPSPLATGVPMSTDYRFSFGPWNIHEGADPFGPTVRPGIAFAKKLGVYKELGFEGVMFHDDDAVPQVDSKSAAQVRK